MTSKEIDAQRDSRSSTDSDGIVIRFINSNPYGNEGEVRRVSPSMAQRLVRDHFAELSVLPAKVDANGGERFLRIQREVLSAAGLVEVEPAIARFKHRRDSQDRAIPALPVRIRIFGKPAFHAGDNEGGPAHTVQNADRIVEVSHDIAIQRIISGVAELAA
jgi:hypothetical protein